MAKTPNIKGYIVDRCRFGRVAPRSLIGVYFGILFAEWFVSLAFLEFSCIVSILYSFAVNEPVHPAESSISVVSTISFAGFFLGLPIIDFMPEQCRLTLVLILVVGLSKSFSTIGTMIQFK